MALFGARGQDAVKAAVELGRPQTLPFKSRSLTRVEATGKDRRAAAIVLLVYALFAGGILLMPLFGGGPDIMLMLAIVLPVALVGGLGIFLVVRAHVRRRGAYQDPLITIDVTDGLLVLHGPGKAAEIPYDQVVLTIAAWWSKGSALFMGIRLESPFGQLEVDDRWYLHGRTTAAAICSKAEARGRPLPVGSLEYRKH